MSIKTEIDRIKQSKADIISALKTKGVTVPTDASIDDLSALVQAIEVGSDPVLQTKSATPKTSSQTIKPDSGYDGLSQVTISAVTSSIDSDIKASNIKKGVNILGVTGTLESGITPTGTMSITSNGTYDVTNYASANVNVPSSGGSGGGISSESVNLVLTIISESAERRPIIYYTTNEYEYNEAWYVEATSNSFRTTLNVIKHSYIFIVPPNPFADEVLIKSASSGIEVISGGILAAQVNEYGTLSVSCQGQ